MKLAPAHALRPGPARRRYAGSRRELAAVRAGHIADALPLPLGQLAARVTEVPRDRPIVVYCGHGERAATAASVLERAGISAASLDGGIGAWRDAGYSVRA